MPCETSRPGARNPCPASCQGKAQAQPETCFHILEPIRNNPWHQPRCVSKELTRRRVSERSTPASRRKEIPAAQGHDESVPAARDRSRRPAGSCLAAALPQLCTGFFRASSEHRTMSGNNSPCQLPPVAGLFQNTATGGEGGAQ